MTGFLAGAITGWLLGVVTTILILLVVGGILALTLASDTATATPAAAKPFSSRRFLLTALILLAGCGVCYYLYFEKTALLAFLFTALLIARMGGSMRGIVAGGIAALVVAWFLPPRGSLKVTGIDNQLALGLFLLGTTVSSLLVKGNYSIKRWVPTTDRVD